MDALYYMDIASWQEPAALKCLMAGVSVQRREKAARLCRPLDRARCLGAEVLLRYALREKGLVPAEPLVYGFGEQGKPFLMQAPRIHFNLSHSGCLVACAIGGRPVGVDVEHVQMSLRRVARRILSPEEKTTLEGLPEEDTDRHLCFAWTGKESYVKWTGEGMQVPMDRLTLRLEPAPSLSRDGERQPVSLAFFSLPDDYVLALCREESAAPVVPVAVTPEEAVCSILSEDVASFHC